MTAGDVKRYLEQYEEEVLDQYELTIPDYAPNGLVWGRNPVIGLTFDNQTQELKCL